MRKKARPVWNSPTQKACAKSKMAGNLTDGKIGAGLDWTRRSMGMGLGTQLPHWQLTVDSNDTTQNQSTKVQIKRKKRDQGLLRGRVILLLGSVENREKRYL
jgi:hypothetical protein